MPFFSHGPAIPSGWVQAPGDVQAEVFLVWQEDEMPDELKQAPGYVPFTLSPDAEEWVRSMAEIRELDDAKGKIIIGRPRPASSVRHRPLIPEPQAAPPSGPAPVSAPAWATAAPAWEPSMSAKEWVRRQAPRAAPAIAVRTETVPAPEHRETGRSGARTLPAIGGTAEAEPAQPARPESRIRSVPKIGPAEEPVGELSPEPVPEEPAEQREKPRRVPQIGPP